MNKPKNNFIIRRATFEDYHSIATLLNSVQLPIEGVKENLDSFLIFELNTNVIGSVGLEIYGNKALLRSLAVKQGYQNGGYGSLLFEQMINEAKSKNISEIILLTETAVRFFSKKGFQIISREEVDDQVKLSVEFRSACPESAICMRLYLQ